MKTVDITVDCEEITVNKSGNKIQVIMVNADISAVLQVQDLYREIELYDVCENRTFRELQETMLSLGFTLAHK